LVNRATYLNSAAKGALSEQVRAAVIEYVESWNEYGAPWEVWLGKVEQARQSFADLIHAVPQEIAIMFCVSTGLNALVSSLDFSARKKIVLADNEFPTVAHILLAQQRRGAEVCFISTVGPNSELLDRFETAIDDNTILVVAHQINHRTGTYLDIARLVEICHAKGALLCVDVYHSAGVIDLDAQALDVDFMITGSMKYLLGSAGGVAFLYVRNDLIPQLEPLFTGWFSQSNPFAHSRGHLDYAPSALRFESGLQPIASVYAALAGLRLISEIGVPRIEPYVTNLSKQFAHETIAMGLKVLTLWPKDRIGPMIALQSNDAEAATRRLHELGIVAGFWGDAVRFSFHLYNTEGDIQRALEAIHKCRGLFDAR